MIAMHPFAKKLVAALDTHLVKQEMRRKAVSRLATGAAFESWLAFETRLVIEGANASFGLHHAVALSTDAPKEPQWLANEHRKVDLFVGAGDDTCLADIEFKLVYNNKNWASQVAGVWRDLFPRRGSRKEKLRPRVARFAVVGLVGKVFVDRPRIGGWKLDLHRWERKVRAKLDSPRIQTLARGRRHGLTNDLLLPDSGSFFQLCALSAA